MKRSLFLKVLVLFPIGAKLVKDEEKSPYNGVSIKHGSRKYWHLINEERRPFSTRLLLKRLEERTGDIKDRYRIDEVGVWECEHEA